MNAAQLVQLLTRAPFIVIFVMTVVELARHPRRANVDIALLFGAVSATIVIGWVATVFSLSPSAIRTETISALAMTLPYLLLRLVDDFAPAPSWLLRFAFAGLVVAVVSLFAFGQPKAVWQTLLYVLYFFGLEIYAAVKFVQQARSSGGVTKRRMQAAGAGSAFLALVILSAGLRVALPGERSLWNAFSSVFALASGFAYFLGFAPPAWLRSAWQEPELRAFLGRAARLPRLPDTASIVRELELGAAKSLGAPHAAVGLWDDAAGLLRFNPRAEGSVKPGETIAGRAFAAQRPIFTANAERDDPEHGELYSRNDATAVLAAPISAGERKLGVLVAYAPRAPIFADDDLVLAQLLADQAAVILESRALIDEAARVQAREEAARLKDDFLSSAAHDLKTPLTTLVAQAQLLERRSVRNPEQPVDLAGVQRIVQESRRLSRLVLDLLDAARLEQGRQPGGRERVDLTELAREVCARHSSERHPCHLEAVQPVCGDYDRVRVLQVIENLVENAVKYSPGGGTVWVKVWRSGGDAHLSVTDSGIGIPATDLPEIFNRFHRGSNVDDRHFAGMGLGLYICKQIVEQHGGRIWASSAAANGSTFHVVLPALEDLHGEQQTDPGRGRRSVDSHNGV